jgi:hypothetical protein
MFSFMGDDNKPPIYEPIDPTIAVDYLMDALRWAHDKRDGWPNLVRYDLRNWCHLLFDSLRNQGVVLTIRSRIVALRPPPETQKEYPARVVDVRWSKPVSTPELRAHAFAAYASAYALYGKAAAFQAAVNETLRRQKTWGEGTCADHTRRFIVPAYQRAFPKAFAGSEEPEPPEPGAPIRARPRLSARSR